MLRLFFDQYLDNATPEIHQGAEFRRHRRFRVRSIIYKRQTRLVLVSAVTITQIRERVFNRLLRMPLADRWSTDTI